MKRKHLRQAIENEISELEFVEDVSGEFFRERHLLSRFRQRLKLMDSGLMPTQSFISRYFGKEERIE